MVTSQKSFCCVLDIRREESPKVLWRMLKDDIIKEGKLDIKLEAEEISEEIGIVKIGDKRIRKFSVSLFSAEELLDSIRSLLLK
jgi:hypothetical protein